MVTMLADMGGGAEEEDARSIEAENGGDEDALDADLEREFLLQQEARAQSSLSSSLAAAAAAAAEEEEQEDEGDAGFQQAMSADTYEDGDDDAAGQFWAGIRSARERDLERESSGSELGRESRDKVLGADVEEIMRMRRLFESNFVDGSAISRRAAAGDEYKLTLFPDFEGGKGFSGTVVKGGGKKSPNDEIAELYDKEFHVPFPKGKEETNKSLGLGLGLPWSSTKCTNSGGKTLNSSLYPHRKMVSGSSSKVSARTATSLERQYSNGSTSTVESPRFVAQERKGKPNSHSSAAAQRLTFSFPGWGVDFSKGEKHPSVVSHFNQVPALECFQHPPKRSRGNPEPVASTVSRGKAAVEENLGDRSPMLEVPDEILLQVMRRLEMRDLCSTVQTCKRWHVVGLQNELWERFLAGNVDCGLLSDSSSDVLPRWVCKKNVCLSDNVRVRFNVFSKGYDHLQRALHEWWDNGLLSFRYPSKGMYSLIRKLTVNDWSLLYEALSVAFIDRTDRVAITLLRKLKPVGRLTGGTSDSVDKKNCAVGIGNLADLFENRKSTYSLAGSSSEFEVHWKSGSVREVSQAEGVVGKELWELLLKSWKRYKGWLHLISTHCPDLNHEVRVERARVLNWTPTLYDKGLICFRSQVVLRYGLRNVLQAGFMFLTTQDARDCTSEQDMDLLRSCHHVLQELDVPDDITLPLKGHTQTKLRQCFRSALSTNSKLALHMSDRLNHM